MKGLGFSAEVLNALREETSAQLRSNSRRGADLPIPGTVTTAFDFHAQEITWPPPIIAPHSYLARTILENTRAAYLPFNL
jgi:hypothetical protein